MKLKSKLKEILGNLYLKYMHLPRDVQYPHAIEYTQKHPLSKNQSLLVLNLVGTTVAFVIDVNAGAMIRRVQRDFIRNLKMENKSYHTLPYTMHYDYQSQVLSFSIRPHHPDSQAMVSMLVSVILMNIDSKAFKQMNELLSHLFLDETKKLGDKPSKVDDHRQTRVHFWTMDQEAGCPVPVTTVDFCYRGTNRNIPLSLQAMLMLTEVRINERDNLNEYHVPVHYFNYLVEYWEQLQDTIIVENPEESELSSTEIPITYIGLFDSHVQTYHFHKPKDTLGDYSWDFGLN